MQNNKFAYLCNISRKMWGMKFIFCSQINTKGFFKWKLSFQVCVWPDLSKSPKITFLFLCNILIKTWVICRQISMKISCKLILWFLMVMVKYSQSSPNRKFIMSLQYFKKDVRDEVDFLHAERYFWRILLIDFV